MSRWRMLLNEKTYMSTAIFNESYDLVTCATSLCPIEVIDRMLAVVAAKVSG
jgi:hypothetical protein